MTRTFVFIALVVVFSTPAFAEGEAEKGDKLVSGMSILGNDEAPKSLVIVPWKSSGMGAALDVSRVPDDGRQPVDRKVFLRELAYYDIKEGDIKEGDIRAGRGAGEK